MVRKKKTDYTLKKATGHIRYEAWMFYETLKLLTSSQNQLEINVLLDAFAIHTRCLFNFFYPSKNPRPDDIIVFDYIQHRNVFNSNKTKKKDLMFIKRKADKQVAHLTYARNRYNQKTKGWPFVEIGEKMHKTLDCFYNNLPAKYKRLPNIKELKAVIDALHVFIKS